VSLFSWSRSKLVGNEGVILFCVLSKSVAEKSFEEFSDMRREAYASVGYRVGFCFPSALIVGCINIPVGGISLCKPHLLKEEGECLLESGSSGFHHSVP
jgi:hypothetical protein